MSRLTDILKKAEKTQGILTPSEVMELCKPKTCETCQFWDKQSPHTWGDGLPLGKCRSPFVCRPTYGPNEIFTPRSVLTCDEWGWTGELITGTDFGCLHWASLP